MVRKMGRVWPAAAALLLVAAPSAMAVTVVNQFPAITGGPPLYFIEGVAFGGGALYYTNSEALLELDEMTGAEVRRQAVSGYLNDLEWVNGEIWAARVTPPSIVRFDPATFAELGSWDTSAVGEPEGITYDGHVALLSVDGPPAMVYELDPGTGEIGNGRASNAKDPEGLAYGEGAVWEAGKDEARLYKVNRQTGAVIAFSSLPSLDLHGLDYGSGTMWASSYANELIYEFDVSDVNAAPTLSWVGTTGYESDGVDPDSGNSLTTFDFRVTYTDLDNDPPAYVLLYMQRDGSWMSGTPFIMGNTGGTSYEDGAVYSYTMRLAAGSTYRYVFWAFDQYGDATGPPTYFKNGPVVSDAPPTLAWAGTPGYVSDGVEPELAQAGSTPIEYRVLYSGTVPAQYVRVHILRGGTEVTSSPHEMATTDPTPHDGALYTFTRKLPASRDYSYYFEASDGHGDATGPPTGQTDGPVVGNRAPVLAWTGAAHFETDGVDPDIGSGYQSFRFRVLYTDADNDWPTRMNLHIARGGTEMDGSPLALAISHGTKPRQGVVYGIETSLARGKTYTYWFEANDGFEDAVGPACTAQNGPVVNSPPYLEWVSRNNWRSDGVRPDTAVGRTQCEFRVVYRDLDGDAPAQVQVEIRRYHGALLLRSPFTMNPLVGSDAREGLTYARKLWLGPGTYQYRFVASDGVSAALGVPTRWETGPTILSDTGATQVTSVAAVPTARGAQITFSLSAPAAVEAEILNVAGRCVRALAPRDCEAGANTLLWNGTSDAGLPAPDGLYLISVRARDEGGGESRALSRVYLRR